MKTYKKITFLLTAIFVMTSVSCKKFLDETPKAVIVPQLFSTTGGVIGGINAIYSNLRNLWGTEGFFYYTNGGTDETLSGSSISAGGLDFFTYNNYVNNVADVYNATGGFFNLAYQDINTLNGVLKYGQTAFTDATTQTQYLAQAKFLRAFYYFHLVETFGDVPLHTTFIDVATLSDSRAPIADVYAQIITDLTQASTELQSKAGETIPSTGAASPFAGPGVATRASALYLLSKAYLTRGWSTAAQSTDFANALSTAQKLIANAPTYGVALYPSYDQAYAVGNDNTNTENLFAIQHSTDTKYGDFVAAAASGKVNLLASFFRPNYPIILGNYPATSGSTLVTRDITNGRPFIRARPNSGTVVDYINEVVFVDKTNDFRYWDTFQTTWIANTAGATTPRGSLTVGADTAVWMSPYDPGIAKRTAFKGVIMMPPKIAAAATGANNNAYTNTQYPAVKKYDDVNRPAVNDPSSRPVVLFRYSEVFLIAAEAAFKTGDYTTEANMLNVIRTRAAARPAGAPAAPAGAVAAMQLTAAQCQAGGIDLILNERSRELFGESLRWWDLTRTQSLVRRVQLYNTEAAGFVKDFEVLRPIPQTEINLVTQGPTFPQNTGF